jgi:DNA uptake protein ComE-like DNA-binding protein
MEKIRVNLANPLELQEIPGIGREQAERIIRFRADHGPIRDATELGRIVGGEGVTPAMLAHVDFDPAEVTAPEAPGA